MASVDDSKSRAQGKRRIVVIVGLPGVGKSTIGRRAAQRLGWEFIDLDAAIEARTGERVRDIFATRGENAFREIETEELRVSLESDHSCVIATGGGVVLDETNRKMLAHADETVWMTASIEDLEKRLTPRSGNPRSHRPLLDGDLGRNLRNLERDRESLYSQVATVVLSTTNRTFDEVVTALVDSIDNSGDFGTRLPAGATEDGGA